VVRFRSKPSPVLIAGAVSVKDKWDGWGYEYKSEATLFGLPLLHVHSSTARTGCLWLPANCRDRPVRLRRFHDRSIWSGYCERQPVRPGGFALAQIGAAYSLIAQVGLYIHEGRGQLVRSLAQLIGP